MIKLEDQLCSCELSKQIASLGGDIDTYFKWVHERSESKLQYAVTAYYNAYSRYCYPAFSLTELLQALPESYIIGKINERWYCKDYSDTYADVIYYKTAVEACAEAYIKVLKGAK